MAFRKFRSRRPVPKRIKSAFGRGKPSIISRGRLQLRYVWNGQKVIEDINEAVLRAFKRAEDDAYEYWTTVAWNPALHPYATGAEERAGRFGVVPSGSRNRARFTGRVTLSEAYPIYHEFGTSRYPGHFPLRQTMDFIAPRIRQYLIEELQAETSSEQG
jgi:hypothetical protein